MVFSCGSLAVLLWLSCYSLLTSWLAQARVKAYFADLLPRVVFRHGSPGMVNTERAVIGESVGQSPKASGPTIGLVQISPVGACVWRMLGCGSLY